MILARALAANVKALRRGHGWSQKALAEEAGISPRWVSAVETCEANVSLDVVEQLAKALKVADPRRLLDE